MRVREDYELAFRDFSKLLEMIKNFFACAVIYAIFRVDLGELVRTSFFSVTRLLRRGPKMLDAVVYTGFRGWGGSFLHWRKQKFRVFQTRKIFKKCFKKAMKNL